MKGGEWTGPEDIRGRLSKLWDGGRVLSAIVSGEPLFPLEIPLRSPEGKDLPERFGEVRDWVRELESAAREKRGFGYEILWKEFDHRLVGRNRLPGKVRIPTEHDGLKLIGKVREAERFRSLLVRTEREFPSLSGWILRRPMVALAHAGDWDRILSVLSFFREHPRPGAYLRQLDIPGMDTKFIESRRGLLSDLLDRVLPPEAVDTRFSGARGFEDRYGLLSKPVPVRFRILDRSMTLSGLSDLSVPVEEFARLVLPVRRVFITENEINGLAFPPASRGMVLFGMGYALDRLSSVPWLRNARIFYWGDIDTHGFAMLDRLRGLLSGVRSFLMDRETLFSCRDSWVRETDPHKGALSRLTPSEEGMYRDLRDNAFGEGVRLEQERIPFHRVTKALEELESSEDS